MGKIGFNSSSVGVCLNAIRARSISTSLLPIHVILRLALECTSVAQAIQKIEAVGGAASSQHILIANAHGGRGLELSPRGGVYLDEDPNGIIVHTNHFLENKLMDEPPWLSGSPVRLDRARSICSQLIAKYDSFDELPKEINPSLLRAEVFSDTFNAPQAICCSIDPTRGALGEVETLFNIIMVFDDAKLPRAEVLFGRTVDAPGSQVEYLPWSE